MHCSYSAQLQLGARMCLLLVSVGCVSPAWGIFSDATTSLGISGLFPSDKVAWGDYNLDGFVDFKSGNHLWRNNQGTSFTLAQSFGSNGIWADYDNDGFLDIYTYNTNPPQLHRNNAGNSFNPVAIAPPGMTLNSRGASLADHNGDGLVDIYVGGYETPSVDYHSDIRLRNNGDDSFSYVWFQEPDAEISPGQPRPARGVTSADFDRDGDTDLYVSNYRLEPNGLYINDGAGDFTDVASSRGATGGYGHTIGSSWGDLDNDGYLDLFVSNFSHGSLSQPGGPVLEKYRSCWKLPFSNGRRVELR